MSDKKEIGENNKNKVFIREPWSGEINTKRFDSNFKFGYVNPLIPYQSLRISNGLFISRSRFFFW